MMKSIRLLGLVLFLANSSFSQVKVKSYYLQDNDTCLNCILESKEERQVFFFYPTSRIKASEFDEKSKSLIKSLDNIKNEVTEIHFIHFKQNLKSDAKGLKLIDSLTKDTIFINYFHCYIKGVDTSLLNRSKNKLPLNFEINQIFANSNLYEIKMKDTSVCIELLNKLFYYNDFIVEAINPQYSDKELIDILINRSNEINSKMIQTEKQLHDLTILIATQEKTIQELLEEILKLKSSLEKSKKKVKDD